MCKTLLHLRVHAVLGLSRHAYTAVATATLIYKVIILNTLLTANYRQLSATAEVLMAVTVKISLFRNVTECSLTYGYCPQTKRHSQGVLVHHMLLEMIDLFNLRV
jgi:hypothetical protein